MPESSRAQHSAPPFGASAPPTSAPSTLSVPPASSRAPSIFSVAPPSYEQALEQRGPVDGPARASDPKQTARADSQGNLEALGPDDLQRFTAAGRPFGAASGAAAPGAAGGFGFGGGALTGQSMLPHRYTDDSIIQVPVYPAELERDETQQQRQKKMGWFGRSSGKGDVMILNMTRRDYLKYCAKDEQLRYIGTEPEKIAREFLRAKIAEKRRGL